MTTGSFEGRLLGPPGTVGLCIFDNNVKKFTDIKYLLFSNSGNLFIFKDHFRFLTINRTPDKKVNVHAQGIIPFHKILSLNQWDSKIKFLYKGWQEDNYFYYSNKYSTINFAFDPKDWQTIPMFINLENPKLNKLMIKDISQYQTQLKNSCIGPYIVFHINTDHKKAYENAVSLIKTLQINNSSSTLKLELEMDQFEI